MKLTNDEIARVFAMYLGCEVSFDNEDETTGEDYLHSVQISGCGDTNMSEWDLISDPISLKLTPLDKISDEHAIEVKNLLHASNAVWEIDEYTTKDVANWLLEKKLYMYSHCFQLLVLNGYAVPLFFGLNHWANGKTAIELGIAIDKTIQPTN